MASVYTEYCWECEKCDEPNRLPYMPKLHAELPPCNRCEHVEMCEEITEDIRPGE